MAYLPENEQDRERRMQEQGAQGPQVASGPSGVITGGQSQAGAQPASKGPSKSGAFTNLNAYIQSNKPQAAQLAENVAGNVAKQGESAKERVGHLQSAFNQQADQGSVQRNQGLVNEAASNATNFVQDSGKMDAFKRIRDATYKGPQAITDVDGYTDAYNAVNNADKSVENTKSEAGRFSLVQDQFKKPSYSRGQQRLDQLLLQNSPEARQSFGDVQNRYSNLTSTLTGAQDQAASYANQRKAETEAARQDVQQAFGRMDDPSTPENEAAGAFGGLQNELNAKVDQYKTQQQALYDKIRKQIGAGGDVSSSMGMSEFDADTLAALGLKEGQKLYNVDLSQFAPQFNKDAVNYQNVATPELYAKYSALSQLMGVNPTYLTDAKLAGTAPGVQVDRDRLAETIRNREAQYNEVAGRAAGLRGIYDRQNNDQGGAIGGYSTPEELYQNITNFIATHPWFNQVERKGQYEQEQGQLVDWAKEYGALNPNRTVTRKG